MNGQVRSTVGAGMSVHLMVGELCVAHGLGAASILGRYVLHQGRKVCPGVSFGTCLFPHMAGPANTREGTLLHVAGDAGAVASI